MKVDILFATFPFSNSTAPSAEKWVSRTIQACKSDHRVGRVAEQSFDDTPITATRNRACKVALKHGFDFLVMIDSDMAPDIGFEPYGSPYGDMKPFWDVALPFALEHHGPCVIGAPYCGPPPHENVYVFYAGDYETGSRNFHFSPLQYSREHATTMGGIQEVIALPTGLILIDCRALAKLPDPYFDYEWMLDGPPCTACGCPKPGPRSDKASTEDVYFSRNLALMGIKQYCAWDSWAGHWKRKCVLRPKPLTTDQVILSYREAILRGNDSRERLVDMGPVNGNGKRLSGGPPIPVRPIDRSKMPVKISGASGDPDERFRSIPEEGD